MAQKALFRREMHQSDWPVSPPFFSWVSRSCQDHGPWLSECQGSQNCDTPVGITAFCLTWPFFSCATPIGSFHCNPNRCCLYTSYGACFFLSLTFSANIFSSVRGFFPFLLRRKQLPWSARPGAAGVSSAAAAASAAALVATSSTVTLEGATMDDWVPGAAATAEPPLLQEHVRSVVALENSWSTCPRDRPCQCNVLCRCILRKYVRISVLRVGHVRTRPEAFFFPLRRGLGNDALQYGD